MLCCFCSTSDLFSSVLLSAEPWSGPTRPFSRLGSKAEPGGRGTKEKVVQFSRIQTHGPPYCHRRSSGGTGVSRQLLFRTRQNPWTGVLQTQGQGNGPDLVSVQLFVYGPRSTNLPLRTTELIVGPRFLSCSLVSAPLYQSWIFLIFRVNQAACSVTPCCRQTVSSSAVEQQLYCLRSGEPEDVSEVINFFSFWEMMSHVLLISFSDGKFTSLLFTAKTLFIL